MAYRIELETRARKELLSLPHEALDTLKSAIDDLESEPRPIGARKLAGVEGYRIRKGPFRVLYTIDDKAKVVRIYRVGHRRDVYRR